MHDVPPHQPDDKHPIAQQAAESKGRIKRPQQTDATMAEKDLPRGSERQTHGARARR